MCNNGKDEKGHDHMAKNMEKIEVNKKDKKQDLDCILAKGINRYDETLQKLSKN